MSVQDRFREYAVLQTLGVRPFRCMRLVVAESTLLCSAGGVFGMGVAMVVLHQGGFAIGAEGATIALRPSLFLALMTVGLSVATGVVAGIAPACRVAALPLATTLKDG
jgi:putative ABC transport system permease protein